MNYEQNINDLLNAAVAGIDAHQNLRALMVEMSRSRYRSAFSVEEKQRHAEQINLIIRSHIISLNDIDEAGILVDEAYIGLYESINDLIDSAYNSISRGHEDDARWHLGRARQRHKLLHDEMEPDDWAETAGVLADIENRIAKKFGRPRA